MKLRYIAVMAMIVGIFASSYVFGALGDAAETTVGATGQYSAASSTPGNATAEGGNVTRVDVERNTSTTKWQGFYGNVSGTLALGLSSDVLYNFGQASVTAIYASQNDSFDFANINWTGTAEVDDAFGFSTPADLDQASDVYDTTITIDSVTTNATLLEDAVFATYAITDQSGQNNTGNFAFGGNVSLAGATGFDGDTWEYEMMVPVNAGTPVYYFFMSI